MYITLGKGGPSILAGIVVLALVPLQKLGHHAFRQFKAAKILVDNSPPTGERSLFGEWLVLVVSLELVGGWTTSLCLGGGAGSGAADVEGCDRPTATTGGISDSSIFTPRLSFLSMSFNVCHYKNNFVIIRLGPIPTLSLSETTELESSALNSYFYSMTGL